MRILVISLGRSIERRTHIRRQMIDLGLEFEFVDAIDKLELDDDRLAELVASGSISAEAAQRMDRGTIACALSHRKALQRVVDASERSALILEDDADLAPDLPEVLAALDEQELGRAVTLLFCRYESIALSTVGSVELAAGRRLHHSMRRHLHMAAAYCVTDDSAASLLAATSPVVCPADVWSMHSKRGGFDRLLVVYPFAAGVAPLQSDRRGLPRGRAARTYFRLANSRIPPFSLIRQRRDATERRLEEVDLVDDLGEFQQISP